jgi:hypothetical protein
LKGDRIQSEKRSDIQDHFANFSKKVNFQIGRLRHEKRKGV